MKPSKELLDEITTKTGMTREEAKKIFKIIRESRKKMGKEAWLGFKEYVDKLEKEEKTDQTYGVRTHSIPELIADYLRQKSLRTN